MSETTEVTQDELTTLKARAEFLGITFHPSIGLEKLREKIAAHLADSDVDETAQAPDLVVVPEAPAPAVFEESVGQRRKRMKLEATALVRIRVTCMNPAKKDWDGEIFSVGNNLVGTLTKYIPFNSDEGWHVPKMMYDNLKERQCQVFTTVKSKNGVSVRQGKLIREFAIEVLPALNSGELHNLAQRQAMAAGSSID